jgi:uncharacterized protein YfaS (alpha-2-macroglobulin family)
MKLSNFFTSLSKRKKIFIVLIFIIIIAGFAGFYFCQKQIAKVPGYSQTYRLVPEKISQSAAIRLYLPPQVDQSFAQTHIKFSPEIKGSWVSQNKLNKFFSFVKNLGFVSAASLSEKSDTILFKPEERLKLNRYYLVELTMPNGDIIKADFLTVEDPEIIAIFPKKDSEAPEDSEITIIFNRPMVPLTTLGYLENKEMPVEITPETKGRFKWITTSNLQFIPEERLIRSSNYKVKVNQGLVSLDGLNVKETESQFITRKLRYLDITKGEVIYNQPISIYFNQPVDLEKTKKEITLIDKTTGKEIPFIAEYKKKTEEEDKTSGKDSFNFSLDRMRNYLAQAFLALDLSVPFTRKNVDDSVIQIYNKEDRFGREKYWDFENKYSLKINQAYPKEGDIILNESRNVDFWVTSPIAKISAESSRTAYASADFFDPQGKLWVNFYEEIDLAKSKITAPKLSEIGYGEKCKEEGEIITQSPTCEKVEDKRKIFIKFESGKIGLGERWEINFEKIVNLQGLTINKEPIKKEITSYPEFAILKTFPENQSQGANLTALTICSNTPILVPDRQDFKNYFKANQDYELNYWDRSYRVEYFRTGWQCQVGEFQTSIGYGLMPETEYALEVNLEDVFGQKKTLPLSFRTGEIAGEYLNFYHFQKSYNVTSPEKTKLTYAVQNMEYVNLEICKIEALDLIYYLENPLSHDVPTSSRVNCQQIIADTIKLPSKYWIKNYFKVDLANYFKDPIGHYILTFSHPNYTAYYRAGNKEIRTPIYERSYLSVTNLAVSEKRISPQFGNFGTQTALQENQLQKLSNLYWVINLSSLEPVSGAKVSLYQEDSSSKRLSLAGSYLTNEQGIVLANLFYNLKGAVISYGADSTIIPTYESKLDWAQNAFVAHKTYLYTDRPIYRPGQEVFVKGIYRLGYDGNYEIYREKPINLKIFNSKDEEILNQNLEMSDFGTFNTKLLLQDNAPLGSYRLCVFNYDCTYFEVQEYVPAPFEVDLKTDKEEYISKETIGLDVQAKYYFGVPLESGEVSYTISSQNYYFDRYADGYFDFGREWYFWPPYDYGEKFLLRGKTSLDNQGRAKISQVLDLEKLFQEKEEKKSKIIVVDVSVKNSQGQTVSAQKSFILHAGEFYLGLASDKYFLGKNEKFNLKIKSVDTQGKEMAVKNISLDIYKTDWIYAKRQEADGGYSYKWEKKRDLISSYHLETDNNGNHVQELQLAQEGEYEAEVSALDKKGNIISTTYQLYVYGEGQVIVRPTNDTTLDLEAEKTDLKVGEQGKIIIKSPYAKAKALISLERGKIFDYQIKDIQGNLYSFDFPVKEEYLPNVYVSVLLVSSKPEIKFGKIEFQINRDLKELEVEVKSNKKQYLPGEEVILDVLTKDYTGKGVSAEVSIAVADLSVLALKGNPKKNPLIFFYDGFPLTVSTASNIKDILVEFEVPTKGGGGMVPEELAIKKRGIFKETAFWESQVITDKEGKAQVKFTLPDNLTTWQTEALAVTQDTKLGVSYQEFTTKKELMVIPLKPRFVVPGDVFYIGAQIFNQSQKRQSLAVKIESSTLSFKEGTERRIVLNPEETQTVYFKTESPGDFKDKNHKFLITAQSDNLQDSIEQSLVVTPNNTYEATTTSNYSVAPIVKEYVFLPDNIVKDRGDLTIKSSATLAVFLSDSLNYLLQFPYGCSEQIASRLKAIAVVKQGLNLPNLAEKLRLEKVKYQDKEYSIEEAVEIGLAELYNNQNYDGGFSFWRFGKSDFYLTLHVVDALNSLSLAGFAINPNSLERASNYLYQKITTDQGLYQNKDTIILTAYTLFGLQRFSKADILKQKIVEISNEDLFIREQISNDSLAYLAILLAKDKGFDESLINKIFQMLDNRIDIDGRGAFLETGKNIIWQFYETPIKNTALYLKAQVENKNDNPILDKVIRWLLNSRSKDGSWGSTQNTLVVIDAFTDFLKWKRETESNFNLELLVNEKPQAEFNFNPQTILDQMTKLVFLKDLKFNEINAVSFSKENLSELANAFYYDLSLKYYLPADQIPPRDEGFSIVREFYQADDVKNERPIKSAKVGEVLREHLQITVPKSRNFVTVEDYIPAGVEIVNLDLATEQKSLRLQEKELKGRELYPDFKEIHDDRVLLYAENLSPGVYEFDYYVRALIRGKFVHLPAQVSEMYFPEIFGRTDSGYFEVK